MAPLLVLILIAVGMFAWLLYVYWAFVGRPAANRRRWAAVAEALNLSAHSVRPIGAIFDYTLPSLVGEYRGAPVHLGVRTVKRRKEAPSYHTYVVVRFARPLRLGLRVRPTHLVQRWMEALSGQRDLLVGNDALDARYTVQALEAEKAQRMLADEGLRSALVDRSVEDFGVQLDDERVYLEMRGTCFDLTVIKSAMDEAIAITLRAVDAFERAGPSSVRTLFEGPWAAVARTHGLAVEIADARLRGHVQGVEVAIEARVEHGVYRTLVLARLPTPIDCRFRLQPGKLGFLETMIGERDIRVGHPELDDFFLIRGVFEQKIRNALNPNVCAQLMRLAPYVSSIDVERDHVRLRVGELIREPATLDFVLSAVVRASAELGPGPSAGVYRSATAG
jgi:hypothetical protein